MLVSRFQCSFFFKHAVIIIHFSLYITQTLWRFQNKRYWLISTDVVLFLVLSSPMSVLKDTKTSLIIFLKSSRFEMVNLFNGLGDIDLRIERFILKSVESFDFMSKAITRDGVSAESETPLSYKF